eukprot:6489741-Amphidinium_carterae.1
MYKFNCGAVGESVRNTRDQGNETTLRFDLIRRTLVCAQQPGQHRKYELERVNSLSPLDLPNLV